MKLGLTYSPNIIRNKFDIDDKYDMLRQRLKGHKIVLSDKDRCKIVLRVDRLDIVKPVLENYGGYKIEVQGISNRQDHPSFIESDDYIIDLGYRLQIFGKGGKTKYEVINITKK